MRHVRNDGLVDADTVQCRNNMGTLYGLCSMISVDG